MSSSAELPADLPADLPQPTPGQSTTEFAHMLACRPYRAADPYIQRVAAAQRARVQAINAERDDSVRGEMLRALIRSARDGDRWHVAMPFFCEYGFRITIGDGSYIGPNATCLDVGPISIGARTLIGPNVQIYTPTHPLSPEERNGDRGPEASRPIRIGDDCWIGGAAILLPGVTIGNGCTVGAGAVVTKDVPDRVMVAGNPARVIKGIPRPEVQ